MSREETIFLGDDTAAAALIRNQRVSAGLQASPLAWFGTVLAAIFGKRIDHTPVAMRDKRDFSRGVLCGLGYDPEECELSRRRGLNPGFVVRGANGHPLRFVSERELRRLADDSEFINGFGAAAVRETSSR